MNHEPKESQQGVTRRQFFKGAVGFSLLATVVGVLYPVINYLWPPKRAQQSGAGRVLAGTLEEIYPGNAKKIVVNDKPVWVVNTGNTVNALSAICTHLGCIVNWKTKDGYFESPCHHGHFDTNGQVISGPPPRPLPKYPVAIEQENIYVGATPDAPIYGT